MQNAEGPAIPGEILGRPGARVPPYTATVLLLLNKPFRVLCQFTAPAGRGCLKNHVPVAGVYPAGRLDFDSEGLVVLTDDGPLQALIADPAHKLSKTYWAQVEGVPDDAALAALRTGVTLDGRRTRPARARRRSPPDWLWPREPPVRYRKTVPDAWIELVLTEGRNRQVRRMTAAVGYPTLRLIRTEVGPWSVAGLAPGQWRRAAVPAGLVAHRTDRGH